MWMPKPAASPVSAPKKPIFRPHAALLPLPLSPPSSSPA
jgi:hypothetical protein